MARVFLSFLAWSVALINCAYGQPDSPSTDEGDSVTDLLHAQLADDGGGFLKAPDFNGTEKRSERDKMVSRQIAARGVEDPDVLAALRAVPRHRLVPDALARHAYDDRPLPIGHGQTISQPYIVALMTELLKVGPEGTVLEVGTGSGYQAAILGLLVRHVVSIEIIESLARRTAGTLESLGYRNLTLLHGDGYFGYEAQAPYDAIIVTAAAEHIPPPLVAQLKPKGRMLLPVGRKGWTQNLILVEKDEKGRVSTQNILPVRFVPLTRKDQ